MATCEICNVTLSASDTTPCGFDRCPIEREGFEICPYCGGEGEVGTGRMSHSVNSATIDPPWEITEKCAECNGSGYIWDDHPSAKCNHWPGQPRCGVCGMNDIEPQTPARARAGAQ